MVEHGFIPKAIRSDFPITIGFQLSHALVSSCISVAIDFFFIHFPKFFYWLYIVLLKRRFRQLQFDYTVPDFSFSFTLASFMLLFCGPGGCVLYDS
jgi:hypothetical protein